MHEKITNSKSSNNITDFQMKSKEQPDLITGVHVQLWRTNNWAEKLYASGRTMSYA